MHVCERQHMRAHTCALVCALARIDAKMQPTSGNSLFPMRSGVRNAPPSCFAPAAVGLFVQDSSDRSACVRLASYPIIKGASLHVYRDPRKGSIQRSNLHIICRCLTTGCRLGVCRLSILWSQTCMHHKGVQHIAPALQRCLLHVGA